MKNYEHHCATGREERGELQGVFSTLGPGETLGGVDSTQRRDSCGRDTSDGAETSRSPRWSDEMQDIK